MQGMHVPAGKAMPLRCQGRQQFFTSRLPANSRGRRQKAYAVSQSDMDELEMHIAIAYQRMHVAAKEDRFKEAAEIKDKLESLRLKHRVLQLKRTEDLRQGICHPLGLVIQHRRFGYLGVIFGVHASCQAAENWIETMKVDGLPLGRHQPFYQVLVDEGYRQGGMVTYVAQENITSPIKQLDGDNPIRHNLVDQMFDGFDKESRKYRPTEQLISQYPDSLEARKRDELDKD